MTGKRRGVLGIDAAWTAARPSGVALVAANGGRPSLLAAAPSYAAFLAGDDGRAGTGKPGTAFPGAAALLSCCKDRFDCTVELVAVDMPLSRKPITERRVSDNKVSACYGAAGAGTHSPSEERPGPVGVTLHRSFEAAGYPLATKTIDGPALIEVYPHPALIELAGASKRLPYKAAKTRSYWRDEPLAERKRLVIGQWTKIVVHLDREIEGAASQLVVPDPSRGGAALKAFEDTLDAVVCAWVGFKALTGAACALGDETSAIWVPKGRKPA